MTSLVVWRLHSVNGGPTVRSLNAISTTNTDPRFPQGIVATGGIAAGNAIRTEINRSVSRAFEQQNVKCNLVSLS